MSSSTPPGSPPLARLPLQIGTTATWSAARSALTLFPSLAIVAFGVSLGFTTRSLILALFVAVPGILLAVFAGTHLVTAVKTRASDLLLYPDGVLVDGGRLHGHRSGSDKQQAAENDSSTALMEPHHTAGARLTS